MAERLHFNTGMAYESMLAAEHLARYWLVKDACKGKRVLDVACGEGYGSALLKKWGASLVVGVDISQDAIANATERFGTGGISYRLGDACDLASVLSADESFDLIVSFETMEHVPDVVGLLRGIKKYLAVGGTMAISCPNDREVASDQVNEFHLREYSFDEFKGTTTDVLGEAVQWLLGTPVLGFGVCDSTDKWMQDAASSLSAILDGSDVGSAYLLPVQAGHEVDAAKAFFYIGVWGTPLPRSLIAAPIAYRAYVGPWNNWIASRADNERLLAEQAKHASELGAVRQQLNQCAQQVERLKRESGGYKFRIASERSARLVMASKLNERDMRYQHMTEKLTSSKCAADEALREGAIENERLHEALRGATIENERLQEVLASRGYRVVQRYYRMYEHDATRWFMRPARRMAVAVRRLFR